MKFVLLQFCTAVTRSIATSLIHVDKTSPGKKKFPTALLFLSLFVFLPCQIFLDESIQEIVNGLRQNCCIFANAD